MNRALKLKRLVQSMKSDTIYYTGTDVVPGLTYREPALVVTWTGELHFIVAPRSGPVLTKTLDDEGRKWKEGFLDTMCTHPMTMIAMIAQDYKSNAAPFVT